MTERALQIELPLHVGTYDIDYAGIVSNIVYLRWLEDLRGAILEDCFPLEEQLATGITPVLVKTEIEYRRPIRLFDKPIGRMWVLDVGRARWTLEGEIILDGIVAARARHVLASVDSSSFRPQRIPDKLRLLFVEAAQEAMAHG